MFCAIARAPVQNATESSPAQCDHLGLSGTTLVFRRIANWYPKTTVAAAHQPKDRPQPKQNGSKQDHRSHWLSPVIQSEFNCLRL